MQWFKTILRELFGLFVDEGSFAVAILAWLALTWLILPMLHVASVWYGVILFAGLAAILIESVLRRSAQ